MPSYVHHSFQFPCTWVKLSSSAARELSITEVTDMAEMVIWRPEKRRVWTLGIVT